MQGPVVARPRLLAAAGDVDAGEVDEVASSIVDVDIEEGSSEVSLVGLLGVLEVDSEGS